jgi:hypothetical protein
MENDPDLFVFTLTLDRNHAGAGSPANYDRLIQKIGC